MSAPYQPHPDVELIPFGAKRGVLVIDGRPWPVSGVEPVFLDSGLENGWLAEVRFENGAIVTVATEAERDVETPGHPGYHNRRAFWVGLGTDLMPRSDDDVPWVAALRDGTIVTNPWRDSTGLQLAGCWTTHENPEPWWLNEWLDRVAAA